jgi:DNA-binding transcriptional MerR regulator
MTALLGISKAAAECGVSERSLRYYEEIGLLSPAGKTPGGLRRYSVEDLDRVRRIRQLQSLLGLNLDEIRVLLESEDRLDFIRQEIKAAGPSSARRRALLDEGLAVRQAMAATVDAKLARLREFRQEIGAMIGRIEQLLDEEKVTSP